MRLVKQETLQIRITKEQVADMTREYDTARLHFAFRVKPETTRVMVILSMDTEPAPSGTEEV